MEAGVLQLGDPSVGLMDAHSQIAQGNTRQASIRQARRADHAPPRCGPDGCPQIARGTPARRAGARTRLLRRSPFDITLK